MPRPAKIRKKYENVFDQLIKAIKAPVDFDLPSALKEWKSGYYVPIKRNVYLTRKRIEDDGIFCSCTPSSGSSVTCDKDCQCGMLFSCCSSTCKCENKCANKSFQHRTLRKTKLIKPTLAIPATSRSGKPIDYLTSAFPALGHVAPSPNDYIKKFSGPPSPLRRPKRSKKVILAPKKKKAKTMAVAVPIPASWSELDAAIDAAAEDFDTEVRQKVIARLFPPQQKKKAKTMAVAVPIPASSAELDVTIDAAADDFDTEVRQKVIAHLFPPQQSPVVQPIDTTPAPDQAIDPTPAANVTSAPASLDPVPTAANTTPGASMKKKVITYQPSRRKASLAKTEKCGFGVIAQEDIKKGEFVIEYIGEVIDDRACEQRLWKMKRQGDTNFYLCEVSSNMVIDATEKGNMSRFINHSCEPNTEMQKWTVEGETRVGIFALRNIKMGEELTYDYKFVQFGANQDCHCGSSNCRKMLGITKPVNSIVLHNGNLSQDQHVRKKRKTYFENCIGEIVRLWHRRHNMYLAASIYDFNERNGIHTLLFTDATIEEFDLREENWDFLPDPDEPDKV